MEEKDSRGEVAKETVSGSIRDYMESRGNSGKQRQEAERGSWLAWQSFHHIPVR